LNFYSDDDLLMLSGIQHFAFCERQWALIHIEQLWQENVRTVEGRFLHERVHNPMLTEKRGGCIMTRSVPLLSRRLGFYGMADLVEFRKVSNHEGGINLPDRSGFWLPTPVEYKRGKPKPDERDEVQLCAQAMCMEEMLGVRISNGELYYGEPKRRFEVVLDSPLRHQVEELSRKMHEVFKRGETPHATKGKKCSLCSMKELCLPALTRKSRSVAHYLQKELSELKNQEV
jgi:CRISPR-associated exonuclease Cas4